MNRLTGLATAILLVGLGAGSAADRPRARPPVLLGGYRVLAADFHVHSSTWSDGALTPLGLVVEAGRQGLDVMAITGHNQVSDAKVARWFSRKIGGPEILVGQEILTPWHHVIAAGIEQVVDASLPLAKQIEAVHAQGGVAIAAHPVASMAPAFDPASRAALDGAEVCHPLIYPRNTQTQAELEAFYRSTSAAAIGSSDFHGLQRLGICRTYVFAADASAAAVIDAIRARRTVVYGLDGRAFGDPALVALAATRPELRERATTDQPASGVDRISAWCTLIGLLGLITATGRASSRP